VNKSFYIAVIGALSIGVYMKIRQPLGIRNNNPLNMRETGIPWDNKTGENGGFTTFSKPWDGIRAAANDIKNKMLDGLNTVELIVSKWAPPSENNTQSYIESVAGRVGMAPGEPILYFAQFAGIVEAMIIHENGQQPYDKQVIASAVLDGINSGAAPPIYLDVTPGGEYAVG
jgi:hypothetical protein